MKVSALKGKRVVVTRATEQAGELVKMLRSAGADVVEFPTIKTVPPLDFGPLDEAIGSLSGFDYALFTSANALKWFMDRMEKLGHRPEEISGLRIVCVGPKTAELLDGYGLKADIVPKQYKAEGVLDALSSEDLSGRRFLFPRAEAAREELPEGLRARGAEVSLVTAYRTIAPDADPAYIRELFDGGGVSAIIFTSSSTAANFVKMVGDKAVDYLRGVCVACIGSITGRTCEDMGIRVSVMPDEYTVSAVFYSLANYLSKENNE